MNTTDRIIKNNLRSWYKSATKRQVIDGKQWYPKANLFADELASKSGNEPLQSRELSQHFRQGINGTRI